MLVGGPDSLRGSKSLGCTKDSQGLPPKAPVYFKNICCCDYFIITRDLCTQRIIVAGCLIPLFHNIINNDLLLHKCLNLIYTI